MLSIVKQKLNKGSPREQYYNGRRRRRGGEEGRINNTPKKTDYRYCEDVLDAFYYNVRRLCLSFWWVSLAS